MNIKLDKGLANSCWDKLDTVRISLTSIESQAFYLDEGFEAGPTAEMLANEIDIISQAIEDIDLMFSVGCNELTTLIDTISNVL